MNHNYEDCQDDAYEVAGISSSRKNGADVSQKRRTSSSKRRGAPTVYNGMHRRRKRRVQW